ncbi:MAG: nitroreductase family deazaflavin-dependent oxidoreductase [Chloroflexi bacterium]|nr:nitroreductase family deazaflavin-dependent oxidoreductase [Chloroflexota bacterium]
MPDFTNPVDSPTEWVADHIKSYVESDGAEGHMWRGVPTLLLTTIGRKSGQARRSALIYGKDGDRYVIVGSRGGAPTHPQWFLNLRDNPEVELQVGAEKFRARARIASGGERHRLFEMMAGVFPNYREYAAKTSREIPVVVLDPA